MQHASEKETLHIVVYDLGKSAMELRGWLMARLSRSYSNRSEYTSIKPFQQFETIEDFIIVNGHIRQSGFCVR